MKKLLLTTLLVAGVLLSCFAQKPHMVVFYNLENLFDTINDPDKLDEEFLPTGDKKWNSTKYQRKQSNRLCKIVFSQKPQITGRLLKSALFVCKNL
mgnify:CR=1 FL=1